MADTLQYGVGRERKGTMFFRSDEMNYGRAVLNSNWYPLLSVSSRPPTIRGGGLESRGGNYGV